MEALNLYQFSDYREFIRAYYESQKNSRIGFSFRAFAKKAGFSSPNFIKLVMEGQKNLSLDSIHKLAKAMDLNESSQKYFEEIVLFSQAKSFKEKTEHLKNLDAFHEKNNPGALSEDDYDYLKYWYYPVVRELVDLPQFKEDPKYLESMFKGKLNSGKIKKALAFLEKRGFLERNASGRLQKKDKTLATGSVSDKEIQSLIARSYHRTMAEKSLEAVTELSKEERNTSNTTLSFSKKGYEAAVERLKALRYELLELAAADEEADRIYHLNLNIFPLTESGPKE